MQFQRKGFPDGDLAVEEPNRLGRCHAQGFEHLFRGGLCRLVNSGMDDCGLGHEVYVSQMQHMSKGDILRARRVAVSLGHRHDRLQKPGEVGGGDLGLARVDFEEDLGVAGEDLGVGARGDVGCRREVIQDNAGAGEAAGADAFEGEEGVIDAAEAVRDDGDHGQAKADGEVGEGLGFCDRNQPTPGAFDEE